MALSLRTRLYVSTPLFSEQQVSLSASHVHYLRNVLRLSVGVELALFNGRDGEWVGRVATLTKDHGTVMIERQARPHVSAPDLWVLFAPIKRDAIDLVAEKATELGARRLWPVMTRHTDVSRVNTERMTANAIEAAEQSERLCVPEVLAPIDLPTVLATWPEDRLLIVCAESGVARPLYEVLQGLPRGGKVALLIGPEGGFAQSELDLLARLPFVRPVRMGQRILRAETATLAALACWQMVCGDW